MIRNTIKVSEIKKKELNWYWNENHRDVKFTDESLVSFQEFEK